ncbi:MAG: PAS domain S-box protein [Deltaproteobacteria bacterium]|nr:PAS domain S-box protein [Deltaproteobacteria bacterium]
MIPKSLSRPLHILLVEDSEHDVLSFRTALQKGRADVNLAIYSRAEDALDRLSADAKNFDLIVTDYKLPGMSGLELCRELKENNISLPILLLVGTDKNGIATEALKIGVDDYLVKDPAQGYLDKLPIMLFDTVRKHIHRMASKNFDEGFTTTKKHLPLIIEDQNEFIRCFTMDGILTYVNDAYCRYMNKAQNRLVGESFLQHIPIEEHANIKKHLASLGRQNPMKTIEHKVDGPNGVICWQEWTDRAVFDDHGQIIEYQSVGRDISEKKRALETFFQSQERYRSLVELIPNGFFICDVITGDFLLINQQACDLCHYSMQEMLTFSLWDLMSSGDLEKLKEHIQTQSHDDIGRLPRETYTIQTNDGKPVRVELSASIVILDGKRVLQGIIQEGK